MKTMMSNERAERLLAAASILRNLTVPPPYGVTLSRLAGRIDMALWNEPISPATTLAEIVAIKRHLRILKVERELWKVENALLGVVTLMMPI
jgi:hypothetical protein